MYGQQQQRGGYNSMNYQQPNLIQQDTSKLQKECKNLKARATDMWNKAQTLDQFKRAKGLKIEFLRKLGLWINQTPNG